MRGIWRQDMLVLTRRVGETLVIGDDVRVAVLGFNGKQVRIGIEAPKHISVHREEVYQRIQSEDGNKSTSTSQDYVTAVSGR